MPCCGLWVGSHCSFELVCLRQSAAAVCDGARCSCSLSCAKHACAADGSVCAARLECDARRRLRQQLRSAAHCVLRPRLERVPLRRTPWTHRRTQQTTYNTHQTTCTTASWQPRVVVSRTALHCTALPCTALPCPALPCTALPCAAVPCQVRVSASALSKANIPTDSCIRNSAEYRGALRTVSSLRPRYRPCRVLIEYLALLLCSRCCAVRSTAAVVSLHSRGRPTPRVDIQLLLQLQLCKIL